MPYNEQAQPVFCDNCTATGDYLGPPNPDHFMLIVETLPIGDTPEKRLAGNLGYTVEAYGCFASRRHRRAELSSTDAPGYDRLSSDSGAAHMYMDLAGYRGGDEPPRQARDREVGERICQYIGACTGPQTVDGRPACPALNAQALDRAATYVLAKSFGIPPEEI
ncbi:MAG TPA: hypothetical protein VLH84_04530 [Patescibacteria group bacterium]|nr:hypothetical protein [Patescibacteria group bacterium]